MSISVSARSIRRIYFIDFGGDCHFHFTVTSDIAAIAAFLVFIITEETVQAPAGAHQLRRQQQGSLGPGTTCSTELCRDRCR
jgi:hypothetical protein